MQRVILNYGAPSPEINDYGELGQPDVFGILII